MNIPERHDPPSETSVNADAAFDRTLAIVLRSGVLLSGAVVVVGAVVYLARRGSLTPQYQVFRGEPIDLRTVAGILGDARAFSGRGLIQLGLLVLIATPVARVVFSIIGFALSTVLGIWLLWGVIRSGRL